MSLEVSRIDQSYWERVRSLRLKSLEQNSEAFGGSFEEESQWTETQWRETFSKRTYLITSVADSDIAIMSIENLDGDFGATCWIGGCWTDPSYRGTGAMRAMIDFIDAHAQECEWTVQGLGVWTNNTSAIAAYEKLGFEKQGDDVASTWHPGLFYQRMIRRTAR